MDNEPPPAANAGVRDQAETRLRRGEFVRFVFFGGLNTLISYGIYLVFVGFCAYPVAYTVSYVAGIFIGYCLTAKFVFRQQLRLSRAVQYPIVAAGQYVVGVIALYALVEVAHLNKAIAPFVVVAMTVPLTYTLSRYVIKRGTSDVPARSL